MMSEKMPMKSGSAEYGTERLTRLLVSTAVFCLVYLAVRHGWAGPMEAWAAKVKGGVEQLAGVLAKYNWLFGVGGVILIIFGFRLYHFLVTIAGALAGGAFGYVIAGGAGLPGVIAGIAGLIVGGFAAFMLHNVAVFFIAAWPGYLLGMDLFGHMLAGLAAAAVTGIIGLAFFGIGIVLVTSFAGGALLSISLYGHFELWVAGICTGIGFFVQGMTVGLSDRDEGRGGVNRLKDNWGKLWRTRGKRMGRRNRPEPPPRDSGFVGKHH